MRVRVKTSCKIHIFCTLFHAYETSMEDGSASEKGMTKNCNTHSF